jgi:CSLREA domain-containing protein
MRALALRTVLSFALAASSASAVTVTVNSTADDLTAGDGQCTLREAIINANTDSDTTGGDCPAGSGTDEIVLPAGNYVQQNFPATLEITSDLNLVGAGADATIIDANPEVLRIGTNIFEPINVSIEGVKITGATPIFGLASGVSNEPGSTLALVNCSVSDNLGIGVSSAGPLTLINTTVSGNSSGSLDGAGLNLAGPATVINSTISGNTTGPCGIAGCFAGGIFVGTSASLLDLDQLDSGQRQRKLLCGPGFSLHHVRRPQHRHGR